MTRAELIAQIQQKQSFLCIGLDPEPGLLPESLRNKPDGLLEFCLRIIEATHKYCVAYKPNTAFFEAFGSEGWEVLEKVIAAIPSGVLKIADAKRGDIGNTAGKYAEAFFNRLGADAVTVNPLMGEDSVKPFLAYPGKWAVVLGLTSNAGALDFQMVLDSEGTPLFERILTKVPQWGNTENLMFVAGATRPEQLAKVRALVPDHFLLVPGVGAQGGNLQDVAGAALTSECGLLVNSSRGIIHASQGEDFAEHAAQKAKEMQQQMAMLLAGKNFN
ncbi:MAG: orotidine-5'-phosphate decarboxylase [Bacteroidota bacterium]